MSNQKKKEDKNEGMEKYAVVQTDQEKTAVARAKKDIEKAKK